MLGLAMTAALALAGTTQARAEAQLLIEASTGKVLHAENATYPWYPASVTKLMTAYTTLRAIKEGHLGFGTMLTVSRNAAAQQPTKMGLKVGTRLTIDNALKMLMVKSANDMAVAIAEGVGGSIEGFADMMNANARRLGMTESHFVNPNGLPAVPAAISRLVLPPTHKNTVLLSEMELVSGRASMDQSPPLSLVMMVASSPTATYNPFTTVACQSRLRDVSSYCISQL